MYKIDRQYTTNNPFWNAPNIVPTGIVIHSIGVPQPNAQILRNNFDRSNNHASVHAFLQPGLVIECLPVMEIPRQCKRGAHVGSGSRGSYNTSRIGVEICEPNSIRYIGGGRFEDLDPKNTREYFMAATDTAAQYLADLCIFHSISSAMISTHVEAHQAGYGTAHSDPNHLWSHLGYTPEQFRKDVQKYINEKEYLATMTKQEFEAILDERVGARYKTLPQVPDWARPSIQKIMLNGFLSGSGTDEQGQPIIDLSHDLMRTLLILERTGAFDKKE